MRRRELMLTCPQTGWSTHARYIIFRLPVAFGLGKLFLLVDDPVRFTYLVGPRAVSAEHNSLLDGTLPGDVDDFPSEFRFANARSVHRRKITRCISNDQLRK